MGAEEQSQSEPQDSAPQCPRCGGGTMQLVRSNPGIGSLRELRTYRCARCGHVETIEAR
jgi:DNA-directed RNA polymerase subunit RPC12/RpoP